LIGIACTAVTFVLWHQRAEKARADALASLKNDLLADQEQAIRTAKERFELDFTKQQLAVEREAESARLSAQRKEEEAMTLLLNAEKERDLLQKRRDEYEGRLEGLESRELSLTEQASALRKQLQESSEMAADDARAALFAQVEAEAEDELREHRETLRQQTENEVREEARKIVVTAMQRLSAQRFDDVTSTLVNLPSEDFKGRLIGREGRNIKAFESITGTSLLIDETPGSVLVSSFDPVRREVARLALEALLKDGRIHPASIEESVKKAEEEMQEVVIGFGEDAVCRVRLTRVHPEVIACLGRLRYRLSNNQNSLDHSVEVANLCGLMAAEIGLDSVVARRAGLFHDIGKVLTEEYEGSHAVAGANFLKRCGEVDERVLNAVAGHHEEVAALSPFVPILMTADSLSAVRPGARADSLDGYVQRVRNLEDIARRLDAVTDAYALQAGREVRIIVAPDKVDDAAAHRLARDVRRTIENELQYPGSIKITVIREMRVSETAK